MESRHACDWLRGELVLIQNQSLERGTISMTFWARPAFIGGP
jgi:hypothetical protein